MSVAGIFHAAGLDSRVLLLQPLRHFLVIHDPMVWIHRQNGPGAELFHDIGRIRVVVPVRRIDEGYVASFSASGQEVDFLLEGFDVLGVEAGVANRQSVRLDDKVVLIKSCLG